MSTQGRARLLRTLQARLASNLRSIRNQKGLTQELLAELSGLDVRHIQKLEAGEVNATLKTLAALSLALDVPPSELLGVRRGSQ
jgi:transcriptional regulator with XRE-family HTH domain